MAFTPLTLSNLAYGNGFDFWHYLSVDAIADIRAFNYFASAMNVLRLGDVLIVRCADGVSFNYVDTNDGANVRVSAMY